MVKETIIQTEQGPMNLQSDDFDWITGQTVKELQNIQTDKIFTQNGQSISHIYYNANLPTYPVDITHGVIYSYPTLCVMMLRCTSKSAVTFAIRFYFSSKWKAKQKQVQIFHIPSNRGQVWIPHLGKDHMLTVKH